MSAEPPCRTPHCVGHASGRAGHVAVGGFEGSGRLRVTSIEVGAHPRPEAGPGPEPGLKEPDLLVGVSGQVGDDGLLLVLLFSGGGTRAAAFGYGVLETLAATPVTGYGKTESLLAKIDLVHGVSGGSILATYLALHGTDTVPQFERQFLRQNLQSAVLRQLFSLANLPRLTAPEYGRGDLLAEELDRLLYHGATFAALDSGRKGPFAVISATDMSIGQRIEFTQEFFDALCLDLPH